MRMKNFMFKFNRVLVCLLALIFSVSICGCGNSGSQSGTNKKLPDGDTDTDYNIDTSTVVGDFVQNGKSAYTIVYSENAGLAVQQAAKEIQSYVLKSTGASVKIATDAGLKYTSDSKFISLGQNRLLSASDLDLDFKLLKHDGYFIKTSGNSIFMTGVSDRGTLYSAYEFLERFVGVKFLAYDYTYVPQLDKIEIFKTDITDNPAFNDRTFLSNKIMSDGQFASKMRMVNEFVTIDERYGGGLGWFKDLAYISNHVHNTLSYVQPDLYYDDYPEWFYTVREGGSIRVLDLDYSSSHLGITKDGHIDETKDISPVKVAVERLKTFILNSGSDIKYFMIGQQDEHDNCKCQECLADDAKYGRSGMNIRFVNAMSEAIEKWMKDEGIEREIYLCTFAYQYSQAAPVDKDGLPLDSTVIPRDNVIVRIAPIQADNYYPMTDYRQNERTRKMFVEWAKVAKKLMIWDYHEVYSHYFGYYPTMQAWQENLKLYKKMGAEYVFMQSDHNEQNDFKANMETYVASKMLWNPDLNANDLRREYIKYYYAEIENEVVDYLDNFEINYFYRMENPERDDENNNQAGGNFLDSKYYSVAFFEGQFELINDMYKKADETELSVLEKEKLVKKIDRLKLYPLYMVLYNYDSYYFDDYVGKNEMMSEFFTLCNKLGVRYYAENKTINSLKSQWGYNG